MDVLSTFGTSMFQFMAMLAFFLILLYWWATGVHFDLIEIYSLFATIFVLFIAVNSLTFTGTISL